MTLVDGLPKIARVALQVAIDAAIASAAWVAAYVIRFDGEVPPGFRDQAANLLLGVVLLKLLVNFAFGTYRQRWRYTSLKEATALCTSSVIAGLAIVLMRALSLVAIPYAVIVADWTVYLLGIAGVRVLRRLQVIAAQSRPSSNRIPTLIVGAGDTAASLLNEILTRSNQELQIVGLLDDDLQKRSSRLYGVPVIGPTTQVESLIRRLFIRHVIIAMPTADKSVIRDLSRRSRLAGASVHIAPAVDALAHSGNATTGPFAVTLEDLLNSNEVKRTLLSRIDAPQRSNTVLVTGGAGYIGNHLVERLLAKGFRVRVLDNFLYGRRGLEPFIGHPNLELTTGDIANIRDVVSAIKGAGTVYALAAIVGDPACGIDAEETLNLNYESTKLLVEACNFYEVNRLVFASSCSVYGASNEELNERSQLNPQSLYARTRIMSEEVILERCGAVAPVILRLATVFGLSRRMRFDLAVNLLTAQAAIDGKLTVFGGDQWRPFIHCQDAADAFLLAGTAPTDQVLKEIFNVGGNHLNFTIDQVASQIAAQIPSCTINRLGDSPDPRNYKVSFSKIAKLGFAPKFDIVAGVNEICAALRSLPELRRYRDQIFSNVEIMKDRLEAEANRLQVQAATSLNSGDPPNN